ncbi:hypothetical protein H2200_005846 [Cladophialophora chaetospira]|uniref:Uncharacterized protein n=1 Tax=Cladophialophora chaetospira TaxID=386627 RepID=A0AA38X9T8_9EURO|nr:hypothetical protein H2200_005846 [Cladophialophora chaetospira]
MASSTDSDSSSDSDDFVESSWHNHPDRHVGSSFIMARIGVRSTSIYAQPPLDQASEIDGRRATPGFLTGANHTQLDGPVKTETPAADALDKNNEPATLRAYRSAVDDMLLLAAEALSLVPEVQGVQSRLRDAMQLARSRTFHPATSETTRHLRLARAMTEIHEDMIQFLDKKTTLSSKWARCHGTIARITDTELNEIMEGAYSSSYQEMRQTFEQCSTVWEILESETDALHATYADMSEYLAFVVARCRAIVEEPARGASGTEE